jgi:iron complex transport system substrate-binding protein
VRRIVALLPALLALLAAAGAAEARPARVVSVNLCSDILVLLIAEPGQVASVTWLAADPYESPVADLAAGLPVNHGAAEEVVRLDADLVVAAEYSARASLALLRRIGTPVVEVEIADSLAGVVAAVETLGGALGVPARAEAVVARLRARLARLADAAPGRGRAALVYRTGGYVASGSGLIDELLAVLGLGNLATENGFRAGAVPSVEALVRARPDLLLVEAYRPGQPSLAAARLGHRALGALRARARVVAVPAPLWACPSPFIADAGEAIAAALAAPDGRRGR